MRVAIVEDERDLARALQKGLTHEEHAVELFYDAASAKEALGTSGNTYDVISLDLMLPDESGAEVCTHLRSLGVRTPILVLTARDSTEDKVDLLDRGADDFLSKPFDFEELLARLRALSRRATTTVEHELAIGALRIMPETRMAYRDSDALALTMREFDLLLYLMLNKDKAVSREELLAKVWKQTDPALTNVVDVHVRNLRKKIDDPYKKKYVHTVYGVGYMLTE